jgi:hypothetical protein
MSAKLGLTTVDIGMPQLSMHSIRETGSTSSITDYVELLKVIGIYFLDSDFKISISFKAFFQNYTTIRSKFEFL